MILTIGLIFIEKTEEITIRDVIFLHDSELFYDLSKFNELVILWEKLTSTKKKSYCQKCDF